MIGNLQYVRIMYEGQGIDAKLDRAIEKALVQFGYEWRAYKYSRGERLLVFDRPIKVKHAIPTES